MCLLVSAYYRIPSANVMSEAAHNFLASLSDEQKAKARFDFKDEERFFWHYIPSDDIPKRFNRPRKGLMLREMSTYQRHLAGALLSAGLSQRGYIKASTIMSLEDVLRILEKDSGERRNPEKYFFSIFGEPSEKGEWGYRVEGHHVSLHFTVLNGKVISTPTFFGSNPHEVKQGPRAGTRPLGREEDTGRELVKALTADQKKVAIVTKEAYKDILTEASRKASLEGQPSGLSASKMTAKQRELLMAIIEEYASNVPDAVAQGRLEQAKKAGHNIFFAWAGSEEKGQGHYYRVQGPTFLIEYDNTQNDANHTHTVWREFNGDWGQDLLKMHYEAAHK